MRTKIRAVAAALALIALAGGAVTFTMFGESSFTNFETGLFSAALVLAASSFGYWQMVQGSAQSRPHHDLQDETDRIDDRFGLWEEDLPEEVTEDAASLFKDEKRKLKKRGVDFKTFLKTARPALSLYRFGAYAVLVYAVFTLISSDIFEPVSYLFGAGAAPLTAAAVLWFMNRR
ncbi:probable integral membrane protein Cj0851c [Hydrogenimonas sp.]|nr:probable integral membrane protein Cj0851c [Hydrogenimonas sp.]